MKVALLKHVCIRGWDDYYSIETFVPMYITEWQEITSDELKVLQNAITKFNTSSIDNTRYIIIFFPETKETIFSLIEEQRNYELMMEKKRKERQQKKKELKTKKRIKN